MFWMWALSESTIGEPKHDDHSQEWSEDAIEAGLEGGCGIASKDVNINGLQKKHESSVDLRQQTNSEDEGKEEDETNNKVSKYNKVTFIAPVSFTIQLKP